MTSLAENSPLKTESQPSAALKESFQRHTEDLDTAPAWWRQLKQTAFEQFEAARMPRRTDVAWRYSSGGDFSLDDFGYAQAATIADAQAIVKQSDILSKQSGRFVFADNQTIQADKALAELQAKGVIWCSLREALTKHGEILKDYFMKQEAHLGSEKFAALHSAFVENGVLLYVPKGVEVEYPFIAYNWSAAAGSALFPHTLVIAEDNAKVKLVEAQFSTTPENAAFSCGVTHLFAGTGSTIDYTLLQDFNEKVTGFQLNSNIAGKDATVKMTSVNVGCRYYRSETHGQIKGSGANVEMHSLVAADENQEIDQRTLQTHSAPSARSDLLFKNALADNARTIFSGLIKVDEGAQQTDAFQTNRNLLLADTAEANSLPGLEIYANDVKCSHGATTSQIEADELFYMLARGIPLNEAQKLIVYGFFEEILERIEIEDLAAKARDIIHAKFAKK